MRTQALVLVTAAVALIAAAGAEPAGFSQLAAAFREAHQAADVDKLAQLVCWDRVDGATRASVLKAMGADLGTSIDAIAFEPLADGETLEYSLQGTTYRPNLEPLGWMVVGFRASAGGRMTTQTRYLVGRQGQRLRIATAAPVAER